LAVTLPASPPAPAGSGRLGLDRSMTSVADELPPSRAGSGLAPARRLSDSPLAAALLVYGAALAWTALVRLPLWRMDGLDDAFYVEVAHLWTRGVLPYVGAFDALAASALFFLARRFGGLTLSLFALILYPVLSELVTSNDAYCPLAALT